MSNQTAKKPEISGPNYRELVGGPAPSPIISVFFLLAFGCAVIAASWGTALGHYERDLWIGALIALSIGLVLAAFVTPAD